MESTEVKFEDISFIGQDDIHFEFFFSLLCIRSE